MTTDTGGLQYDKGQKRAAWEADLGSVHDSAKACGNATAQEADRLEGSLLVDLGHTHFMNHCVL